MNCGACRWFVSQSVIGLCKRYPQAINKQATDWCGEFCEAPAASIIETIMPPEPTKRRGRPPKANK